MYDDHVSKDVQNFSCPIPITDYKTILIAHGGGGKLSQHLLKNIIVPAFQNPLLEQLHDGAMFTVGEQRIAFSTDSYVVQPLFFPGGDIGTLAVNGTANDLAMCGAIPKYLSVSFIIEEGLPMEQFKRIVESIALTARQVGVELITGDTKVVNRGKGDGIFITTSGIGVIPPGVDIHPRNVRVDDAIILSGSIGEHGIAILSVREGIEFETEIKSDCASLASLVQTIFSVSKEVHVLRDPTRGGLASALNEIAEAANVGIEIDESSIPIREEVRSACEILGLDPLYVANEGKLLAFVPPSIAHKILAIMRSHPLGYNATIIGRVVEKHPCTVVLRTNFGTTRVVDMISGEQLPRIC
ncbi:MAG: hydrogenase expression/formation protein HypE [Bacteroidetes bacterium]|nr:hydrogenase expression/formation protein HypE [Bacteroidota bacterium]